MANWQFTKGLHALGNGCYAYLQPDGGWGYSNAGLIVDGSDSLLIDTLMDLKLTREMLDAMRRATSETDKIRTIVNTHSNPDHTNGNQLLSGVKIISTQACLEEMRERPARRGSPFTGEALAFFNEVMGPDRFDRNGIVPTLPTRTFDGELTLQVGSKTVELHQFAPAHTRGDLVAYVPEDRTAFAGDLLFIEGHPIIWAGPVENWIAACDRMLGWDLETVVPGHGPITDKAGIRTLRDYFIYVRNESRKRFDAGMGYEEAARDISLRDFSDWIDAERIVVNVYACYRGFTHAQEELSANTLFAAMGRIKHRH
jgi:glyoxylase-like metal-dependent hydrolase (beta-lactamase superfamily II)